MASGRAHDRATLIVSAPIGIAAAVLWGAEAGFSSPQHGSSDSDGCTDNQRGAVMGPAGGHGEPT